MFIYLLLFLLILLVVGLRADMHIVPSSKERHKGGVYWCETPENFSKVNGSIGIECDHMTLLTSSRDSFTEFKQKLLNVMLNRSALLDSTKIQKSFQRNHDYPLPSKVDLYYYVPLLWALQKLSPNQRNLWLEFGVFKGYSSNITSAYKSIKTSPLYGFDSFIGIYQL
jgi:hypothetical protein